jgi:hypothetical protein
MLGYAPATLDELMAFTAYDDFSLNNHQEWYAYEAGGPVLPVQIDNTRLDSAKKRLKYAADKAGLKLTDTKSAVVFEDRFNTLLSEWDSKARASWNFVAGHLRSIWDSFGHHNPYVVVDRQGGRKDYFDMLIETFPEAILGIVTEKPAYTRYRIQGGQKSMDITLQINSEQFHLPVAQASMTAKYVRELFMMRFQEYWRVHAPEVKPTFGYFGDGKRFLKEIEHLISELGIDRDLLIRKR